jgi:NAD(P)-dependent dehydrogenase (short-subunit alcohol dehydrogenase family)
MNLDNKVAVVTGSGQGLGLAYAQDLARHGAAVVINDVNQATADAAVSSIVDAGGRAVAVVAPVGSTETAQKLVAGAVEAFGRLDVMVTTCARESAVHFRAQGEGGRIVCIGSPAGQRGNFGQTNYSGSKAGIVGMVRTWAMELQRAGVTVNAVCPVAATAMTETIPFLQPYIEAMHNGDPLPPFARRELGFGTPADAAGIVSFLASDASADVTGQAFAVGGDRLALWTHPDMIATSYHDGGWSAENIAAVWPSTFADSLESVGENLPVEPAR